jgi:hypothetical protein
MASPDGVPMSASELSREPVTRKLLDEPVDRLPSLIRIDLELLLQAKADGFQAQTLLQVVPDPRAGTIQAEVGLAPKVEQRNLIRVDFGVDDVRVWLHGALW